MTENSGLSSPVLPGGTVTFLFTDIEGSTELLNQLRDQYAALLAGHHKIIREALEKSNGREVDTQGDAFFAAFPKATEAVAAVAQIQRELAGHSWPEGAQVRVRMGLHTGEPWLVEEGYVGMDVHRAARIGHVGYGGQVLLSGTTTALVQDDLPEGVTLLDLGRHRLKDMRRPEPIQQLVIEGLPAVFPPLKSLEALPAAQIGPPGDGKAGTPREVGPSPYRGLAAFQETDAELFFGREEFIDQLALAVGEQQLVAVIIGPSGAGKSSAVFAGLLPQLREEGNWLIVEMRPGARPFHALAAAILPTLEDELTKTDRLIETQKLAQALRDGELSLFQVADLALSQRSDADRLLLVIDQFEEIFTFRPDPEDQQLFLDELLAAASAAANHRRAPLVLLLTLRADFMGQALGHRPFTDALQEGALILGPMNQEELRTAVEKPAELAGAAFEPGLVPRILDDIGDEPGNLPLLEFALTLLWDRLEDGWMTHAAYDEIGRVDGALARYAEEVWDELDETEREGARPLFVQLVQPGEGTEDTRRVARRTELAPGHWTLVQHLADRRLVVTGQDEAGDETVEVVHEALIRGWERLRSWMMADRAFRTWQEGLRAAQRGWESSGRDDGSLLRAAPLALALEWAEEHQTELSASELEFIESSREASEKRAAEEAARRQRELETAQKLAEAEHARAEDQERAAIGLRRRAYFLGGVLVVAVMLAIAAFFFAQQSSSNAAAADENAAVAEQNAANAATSEAEAVTEAGQRATAQTQAEIESQRADGERDAAVSAQATAVAEGVRADEARVAAEEQARIGFSRELAAEAVNNLDEDPERSVLLALQALRTAHTQEAEEALHRGIPNLRHLQTMVGHEDGFTGIDYSPDGSRLVTANFDDTVRVWDTTTGQELLLLSVPEEGVIRGQFRGVAYSSDGSFIVTVGDDGTAKVWDAATGELSTTYTGHSDIPNLRYPDSPNSVYGLAISPDSKTVATGDTAGLVKLWDAVTGAELTTFDLSEEAEIHWHIRFSPDGSRLVVKGDGFELESAYVRIIGLDSGSELLTLKGGISDFALSPDGTRLLVGDSFDKVVRLWDLDAMAEMARYPTGEIDGLAFSPDGSLFSTQTKDLASVHIWETETGREVMTVITSHGLLTDILFSPDGTSLATAGWDQLVKVWDIGPDHEVLTVQPFTEDGLASVSRVTFSPDGTMLAAGGVAGGVSLWDPVTGDRLLTLEGHDDFVGGLGFSPDGDRLASGSDDGTVKVWDTTSGELLLTLTGHEDWVNNMIYSPDGATIASVGNDKQSFVWDATTGEVLHQLPLSAEAWGIAYSPDSALLATGALGKVGNVTIWDMATGQAVRVIDNNEGADEVHFSVDGLLLITGGVDGFLRIWDIGTGQLLQEIEADQSIIWGLDVSPDGTIIATAAGGSDARLWDLQSGERLLTLEGAGDGINLVEFTPDGKQLVTAGSPDGYVRFYVLSLDELVDIAESRLTRSLTEEECQEYLHMDACPVE